MKKKILLSGNRIIEYELIYKNVKNINLRVKSDGTVHVSANKWHRESTIERFIYSNSDMILKSLEKYEQARKQIPMLSLNEPDHKLCVFGEPMNVEIRQGTSNQVFSCENKIVVYVRNVDNTEAAEKAIDKWLVNMCSAIVLDYCRKYYPYFSEFSRGIPDIKFRKMKSRWGSCRPAERILTFNTRLVHTPRECIEYVVVHEFAHFVHADHSKKFYDTVDALLPDWKQRRNEIRKYEILLT